MAAVYTPKEETHKPPQGAKDSSPMNQRNRRYYEKRLETLRKNFQPWRVAGQELGEVITPWRGKFLLEEKNRADRRATKIINSTPQLAARTLASGMLAGFTSPARPWFRIITADKKLYEINVVKTWLHDVEVEMFRVFARSNLYNALPVLYEEMGVFGTGAVLALEDDETVMRFYNLPYGSFFIATSERGNVDTLYHERQMTVRQAARMFGRDKLSSSSQSLLDKSPDEMINICLSIEPNENYNKRMVSTDAMAFVCCWWERGCGGEGTLRKTGFNQFPCFVPRWTVSGDDDYGRGVGHDARGDVLELQLTAKRKAQLRDKLAAPPFSAPSSLRNKRVSQMPGDITFYDATSNAPMIKPMMEVNPQAITVVREDIKDLEERINRAFYVDLFMMLTMSDRREITAREVEERHAEKLLMLAPVLERLQDELLDKLIERTYQIMMARGLLPEIPKELQQAPIKIEYISILSQAQRSVGMAGLEHIIQIAGNMAQLSQDPSVWDKIDMDQIIDEAAEMLSSSPRIIRSDVDVEQMRAQKAQAQQAGAQAQQAAMAAEQAKTMSETKTGDGQSALDIAANGG